MTYFSKNFSQEVVLPDGNVASCVADVEHFLKASNLAVASDYSQAYFDNIRYCQEKKRCEEIFTTLIQQYKKRIWND